jgi:hypothetical protein
VANLLFLGLALALLPAGGTSLWAAAPPKDQSVESWPEITPEERALKRVEQDPDADAIVLLNERNGKILRRADDFVNVLDYHFRYKILTERGKRYGDVEIEAGKYSRVSNIRARTVKPDGTAVTVAPDQIFEKVTFQVADYKETAWVFHFPAVEPGAILELRYDRHDNSLLFIDPFYFARSEFTLRARMTQAIPEDMGYTVLCDLCPGNQSPTVSPWREGKAKGQMYTMELRDLPGYKEEQLMPPPRDANPRLEMLLAHWKDRAIWGLGRQNQFFIDWPSVALYAWSYYQDAMKTGLSDMRPVVAGWVQGITEPQEKVKAVFLHVQRDFRYRPYTQVFGRSHSIEWILKQKLADNEDKAVLLMTALKAIGMDSYTALVSGKDGGSLNPKFFSLSQFTHTVLAVPQTGGGYLWLDPTISHAPFGFVPWKDSGAEALLIKDGKGEMVTLPAKNELTASRYKLTVKPRKDGKADVDVEAEFIGEDAVDLREELVPAAESARKTYLEKWVQEKRNGAVLNTYVIENLEDQDRPLRLKLGLEVPGLVTSADEVLLVRGCVLTCEESNPISRGPRRYPFYVDRGWNEDESVVIPAPEGMKPSHAPPSSSTKSSVASHTFSCLSQDDQSVKCSHAFVARRNRWPASEQANVRAMFDKIVEADRTTVAFERSEGGATRGR